MQITFESMPGAIGNLLIAVETLNAKIEALSNSFTKEPDVVYFDLNQLVEYDPEKRSKQTFYQYVSNGEIPVHKRNKKLIFVKSEIDNWLKEGKTKVNTEVATTLKKKEVIHYEK